MNVILDISLELLRSAFGSDEKVQGFKPNAQIFSQVDSSRRFGGESHGNQGRNDPAIIYFILYSEQLFLNRMLGR